MFIESIRIQGYKSLEDVTLSDLGPINVFHGYNDVGKSNILEALDLLFQVLPVALEDDGEAITSHDVMPYDSRAIFRLQTPPRREIKWSVRLRLEKDALPLEFEMCLQEPEEKKSRVESPTNQPEGWALSLTWPQGRPDTAVMKRLATSENGFTLLSARRRFEKEFFDFEEASTGADRRTRRPEVSAATLKRTLFNAYASLDLAEREHFRRLGDLLKTHFDVGVLDVALSKPQSSKDAPPRHIVLRFLRDEGLIPLEDVGSGVRQVLLLLGQIIFNSARAVGIEEPEMNLSPEWQMWLMGVFRDLVQPGADSLEQLFIVSHSPVFEFQNSFYQVTYKDNATHAKCFPLEERASLFGPQQPLGEQRGQQLNSQNQITLYREVLEDLGLEYGDMVYFNKDAQGRWGLFTEDEALADLQEAWDDDAD